MGFDIIRQEGSARLSRAPNIPQTTERYAPQKGLDGRYKVIKARLSLPKLVSVMNHVDEDGNQPDRANSEAKKMQN